MEMNMCSFVCVRIGVWKKKKSHGVSQQGKRKSDILFMAVNPVSGWCFMIYKLGVYHPQTHRLKNNWFQPALQGETRNYESRWNKFSFEYVSEIKSEWRTNVAALFCLTHQEFHAVICATSYPPRPSWQSRWLIMITMFFFYLALTSQRRDKLVFQESAGESEVWTTRVSNRNWA